MSNFNYDTYCGIYCGACSIHMAYKTGYKDQFASYWTESTVKAFLQAQGVTITDGEPIQLKCHGCKTDTVFANCKPCKIRNCAINKKIEHCAIDCGDFPCDIWQENKGVSKDFIDKLPHLKSMRKNLQTIKEFGVNQWLAEQEKQWKCPDCQTNFSWYTTNCTKCGKDLEKMKDYNNL